MLRMSCSTELDNRRLQLEHQAERDRINLESEMKKGKLAEAKRNDKLEKHFNDVVQNAKRAGSSLLTAVVCLIELVQNKAGEDSKTIANRQVIFLEFLEFFEIFWNLMIIKNSEVPNFRLH